MNDRSRATPRRNAWRSAALAIVLASAALACAGDAGDDNGAASARTLPPRQAVAPYVARPLAAPGRVTGWVEIEGEVPTDTVFQPASDVDVCGAVAGGGAIDTRRGRLNAAVVWVDGVRSGKPLPIERRFEVTNQRCGLTPRTQSVIAGGTLNVRSADPIDHRTRIVRQETGEVLAVIRHTDNGQVVPDDRALRVPGLLVLSCDLHPWTRGSILVFDHPYYASTAGDGTFVIDSLPSGRHRVVAWHERLGTVADSVTVEDGKETRVVLKMRAP